ncbi:MAG: hypothetical protein KDK70_41420, partial [Myxococcales bacterium]|nr:hypothetical protein [Myxococcales bacterium]
MRVRQILTNYLGNALKFTDHGEVRLSARRLDAERVRFEVSDTGPGIDEATQARLFQPFTQADQSTTRRYGGTGLGLSICRELASLMGGTVGVHSEVGRGSCFWAELPLPVAAGAPLAAAAEADPAAALGAHVLLVDDNEVNMMVAVAQLEQVGVRVGQAAGPDGLHELEPSKDRRTVWHRVPSGQPCEPHDAEPGHEFGAVALALDAKGQPQIAVFEHPEGNASAPGRLRHAVCTGKAWTSSIVAEGLYVAEVGLAVDDAGKPHLFYVADLADVQQVVYAVPTDAAVPALPDPGDRDARVLPALEACMRVHQQPPPYEGIQTYQQGDAFRCAVIEREPAMLAQAEAVLEPRCEGGQAEACGVAASLRYWLMAGISVTLEIPKGKTSTFDIEWRGLRPKGSNEDVAWATQHYGRGCELGDARSCLLGAAALSFEDPRRLAWATLACEAGQAHGCALAVIQTGMYPGDALAERATDALSSACAEQDMTACNG